MSLSHISQSFPVFPIKKGKNEKQRIKPGFKFPLIYNNIKNIYIYNSHKWESERGYRPGMLNPVLSLTFQKMWEKGKNPYLSDVTIKKYSGKNTGKTGPNWKFWGKYLQREVIIRESNYSGI